MNVRRAIRRGRLRFANWRRSRRHVSPWLAYELNGTIVEFTPPTPHVPIIGRWLPKPPVPISVNRFRWWLEQLAYDPRVKGLLLRINCSADAATYQSLRGLILDFRKLGKQVVAYAESFSPFQYYLACACDRIIMPPSAEWMVLGFQNEYLFLKDALERVGVGVDVINVSPFKSAGDQFVRRDFSEESRAQAEWLLDARFDTLVRGIAEGRKLDEARVRELIDQAPFSAQQAVEHGLIDSALYEDEIAHHIMPAEMDEEDEVHGLVRRLRRRFKRSAPRRPRDFVPGVGRYYADLVEQPIDWSEKWVAVVKVEGTIIEGKSTPSPLPIPFFDEQVSGSESIAGLLRSVARDSDYCALVLYVDSPGGSALASDLIAREVQRVRKRKPVVVYMSGVAASGGYYVAAPANYIVAQPMTLTGSIGVISLKPNTQKTFDLISINRVLLKRGERSGIFSDATPLSDDERTAIEGIIGRSYDDFKKLVAENRGLDLETIEPVCGGRVWTGEMALERKLVDALGDFRCALAKALELAHAPADKRTDFTVLHPYRERFGWLSTLTAAQSPRESVGDWLNEATRFIAQLSNVRTWAILPWRIGKRD